MARREKVRRTVSVGKANERCNTGRVRPQHCRKTRTAAADVYREGRSGSILSSRVSDVQILAFVLLEPSAGKLACSVPRGPGVGNRAWLPS